MEGDFRLGPWVVQPSLNNISRSGRNIRLEPKAMEVMVCLARHRGGVVPKERLIGEVWPDTFVGDDALTRCISELRRAFEDDPKTPQVIETIPKRGYRVLVKVEPIKPRSKPPYAVYGITATIVVAVFAVAYWLVHRIIYPPSARSVVVLPFKNSSGDTAQDSFTEGLTFLLTNQLAQISALQVISYPSARQYKDTRKSLREIAAEMKADAVVEGEILRSGDQVSLQVQLINAGKDRQLWAHEYHQELGYLTTLASDCAREIATNLGVKITFQEQARLRQNRPRNPAAYDAYLQARSHLWLENVKDNDAAIDLLEQAIKLDPDFAVARAALARAYRNRTFLFNPHDTDSLERANYEAQKAHDLDPELSEAHLELGYLQWTLQNHFQHEAAITEIRKALELNPSLAEAHHQLGNIYNHIGLLDRAKAEIDEAVKLDPANTGARYRRAVNLLYQGDYQEALVAFEGSQRFIPCLWATQNAFALFQLGRKEDAASRVDEFLTQCPQDNGGNLTAMQALLSASVGDRAQAELKIQRAIQIGEGYQHFHHTAYIIGSAYALMNQPEPAVRFLRQSAEQGFPCYPFFERDPNLNNLRSDPTFVQFMADLKKQWEYFRANLR